MSKGQSFVLHQYARYTKCATAKCSSVVGDWRFFEALF
jgi:hypothetical protein